MKLLCIKHLNCCKTSHEQVRRNFPSYWQAKQQVKLESYHLSHQLEHQLAFIDTASRKMLPITKTLMKNPYHEHDDDAASEQYENLYKHQGKGIHHHLDDHRSNHAIEVKDNHGAHYGETHTNRPPPPIIDGHSLIKVICPNCSYHFHCIDQGYQNEYECPACKNHVIV